ncbi:MAG: hypothetical protein DWQ44_10510 [Bacteroidetes bacterium]|nr:MAG: hypothetical protein DWQ33_04930 [Bacteroidota bacterium]REK04913.1 MAG: hypothetical protein DWQ39_06780 [Bacteroidota bacterium]REK32862.1 MAG: hypothetical protein DWQ44_10510 [Bacteroidota bacterium]REK50949.1 MAG: hypothetical protein DWQ48_02335 [Bacteroidota bacterium]
MYRISTLFSFVKNVEGIQKSVVHSLAFRITGLALIYLSQVLLARLMGVKGYGEYTVIITAINFLLVFSLFGLDTASLRFIPSAMQKKEFGKVQGFVKFSVRMITFLALVASAGIFTFLIFKSRKFSINFSEALFWSVLLLPFLALVYQSSSILRAFHKVKASMSPIYFYLPVFTAIGWLYYYNNHNKLGVDAVMMINLICTILVCIIVYRRVSRHATNNLPEGKSQYERSLWMKVSSTLFLVTFIGMLQKQSDIFFVNHFLGFSKAGIYGVASKLAFLVALGLSVVDYVFVPKISGLWESGKKEDLCQMMRQASRQILMISLPLAVILLLGGKFFLGFFGKAFTAAYGPMMILIFAQLVNALTGMAGSTLAMTGHHAYFFLFGFISFLIQVLLNVYLIPEYGVTGAAIASATAIILFNLMSYYFVKKKLGLKAGLL